MEAVVTEVDACKRRLEVTIPAEEYTHGVEKACKTYQKKMHIDGFRKGKVPLGIIQKQFGEAIKAEVTDELVQTFFRNTIIEKNLNVVAPGVIKDVSHEEGGVVRFTAEVDVEPGVTVSHYKGLKLTKEVLRVTEEDVDRTIDVIREQRAENRPVDGGAEAGHLIQGDIQAIDHSGVPIIGSKWEDRQFEIGKPPMVDEVETQILGARAGESRRFRLVSQRPDAQGNMQSHEEHYTIQVKEVYEKILPDVDDAFAQELGDYADLKALKKELRSRLEAERSEHAERQLRSRIADEIVKTNDLRLPESMIENILRNMWEDEHERGKTSLDETAYKEQHRAGAVWNLKWYRLWNKIAEVESLEVTETELDDQIDKLAKAAPKEEKKIRALLKDVKRRERMREDLLEEKVMVLLKEHGKIKEVVVKSPKSDSGIVTLS